MRDLACDTLATRCTKLTEKKGHRPKQPRAAIWRPKFLAAFRQTGNVTRSAEIAGITKQGAYKAYHHNKAFRSAWDKAEREGTKLLEDEVFNRAKDGVDGAGLLPGQDRRLCAQAK